MNKLEKKLIDSVEQGSRETTIQCKKQFLTAVKNI